ELDRAGYFWESAAPYIIRHNDGWSGSAPTSEGALTLARSRAAAKAGVDWNAIGRESYRLGGTSSTAAAWIALGHIVRLLSQDDTAAAIGWLLIEADLLAPHDLTEMAAQLDDQTYEALACYRRDRSEATS